MVYIWASYSDSPQEAFPWPSPRQPRTGRPGLPGSLLAAGCRTSKDKCRRKYLFFSLSGWVVTSWWQKLLRWQRVWRVSMCQYSPVLVHLITTSAECGSRSLVSPVAGLRCFLLICRRAQQSPAAAAGTQEASRVGGRQRRLDWAHSHYNMVTV